MLKPAYSYKDKLQEIYNTTIFNDKYKYYNFNDYWDYEIKLSNDSWNNIEMVSVDKSNNILGFFRATISRSADKISDLGILNFYEPNIIFSRDLREFIVNIFDKYNFRKISFCVVVGNPIEKMYDKYIEKYGGNIIGTKKQDTKLIDGKYYDVKFYEIFKDEFDKARTRNTLKD